jgi:hypothetical protein
MALLNQLGNTFVSTLTCGAITLPNSCVTDAAVEAGADIEASKLMHQHPVLFAQTKATTTTAFQIAVYTNLTTNPAGANINLGYCSVTNAATTGVLGVDVLINGTSCLVGPAVINSTIAAYQLVAFDFASTTVAPGDVVEFKITVTSGTPNCGGFLACLQMGEFPS